jgi:hypothetical protein
MIALHTRPLMDEYDQPSNIVMNQTNLLDEKTKYTDIYSVGLHGANATVLIPPQNASEENVFVWSQNPSKQQPTLLSYFLYCLPLYEHAYVALRTF